MDLVCISLMSNKVKAPFKHVLAIQITLVQCLLGCFEAPGFLSAWLSVHSQGPEQLVPCTRCSLLSKCANSHTFYTIIFLIFFL